ncbi:MULTISPECIES: GntR family transcriptional regulator [Microbacterium]|uniref:GntR family transcriptional regulator n=1 Tax=Microbacterium TaxID=33882 RepID=UPI0027840F6A|nr:MULTISPECIES: GntR family transcriptional regulator [Microbacterium]MDQ1075154.1 DNA-binding GntR family transcriptional regulator [Microbacterium sp. SORGH_AS_0969]MDQ1115385.1 DNA-binding GntR family transcriptional regulator [Microbacterium testaceum]
MNELLGGRQVQRHAPIREQVASIIRDAIVEMRLEPGQVLVERELCEMTQASRPSVREALRQLAAEGLVESHNGKGTVVAEATPELAEHVYQVRAELEGLAAELFARDAADEQVREFAEVVAELRVISETDSPTIVNDMLAAKNRAYDILFEGAGNPILTQMIGILHRRVTQLRALTLAQPGRPAQTVREIEDIVDAIERRDTEAARRYATSHVHQAARTVLGALGHSSSRPIFGADPTPKA